MDLGKAKLRKVGINNLYSGVHPQHGVIWTDGKAIYLAPIRVEGTQVQNATSVKLGEFDQVTSVHWSCHDPTSPACHLCVVHQHNVTVWRVSGALPKLSFKQVRKINVRPIAQGCLWNPTSDVLCLLSRHQCSFYFRHDNNKGSYAFPPLTNGKISCGCWGPDGQSLVLCVGSTLLVYRWPDLVASVDNFTASAWPVHGLEGHVTSVSPVTKELIVVAAEVPLESLMCRPQDVMTETVGVNGNTEDGVIRPGKTATHSLLNIAQTTQTAPSSRSTLTLVHLHEGSTDPSKVTSAPLKGILTPDILLYETSSQCVVVGSNSQSSLQIYALLDKHLAYCGDIQLESGQRPKGLCSMPTYFDARGAALLILVGQRVKGEDDGAVFSTSLEAELHLSLKYIILKAGYDKKRSPKKTKGLSRNKSSASLLKSESSLLKSESMREPASQPQFLTPKNPSMGLLRGRSGSVKSDVPMERASPVLSEFSPSPRSEIKLRGDRSQSPRDEIMTKSLDLSTSLQEKVEMSVENRRRMDLSRSVDLSRSFELNSSGESESRTSSEKDVNSDRPEIVIPGIGNIQPLTDSFSMVTSIKDEAQQTRNSGIIEEVSPSNDSTNNDQSPLDVHTASFASHKPSFHNDKLATHFELHSSNKSNNNNSNSNNPESRVVPHGSEASSVTRTNSERKVKPARASSLRSSPKKDLSPAQSRNDLSQDQQKTKASGILRLSPQSSSNPQNTKDNASLSLNDLRSPTEIMKSQKLPTTLEVVSPSFQRDSKVQEETPDVSRISVSHSTATQSSMSPIHADMSSSMGSSGQQSQVVANGLASSPLHRSHDDGSAALREDLRDDTASEVSGLGSSLYSSDSNLDLMERQIKQQSHCIQALQKRLEDLSKAVDKSSCVFPTRYHNMEHPEMLEIYCDKPEGTETKRFLLDNGRLQLDPVKLAFGLQTVELWLDGVPCVLGANIDGYIPMKFSPSTRLHISGLPADKIMGVQGDSSL